MQNIKYLNVLLPLNNSIAAHARIISLQTIHITLIHILRDFFQASRY